MQASHILGAFSKKKYTEPAAGAKSTDTPQTLNSACMWLEVDPQDNLCPHQSKP